MDADEIRQRIEHIRASQPGPDAVAKTYHQRWESDSKPVLLTADDGNDYVVKGLHKGRVLVNDRVVGLLGALLGAPVAYVALIDVPHELISLEPEMSHMSPGISHGTLFLRGCGDREGIAHADGANRDRFARLAVLYGWALARDLQVIYENAPPHIVHSVDHGHFFPSGPNWTEESLAAAGAPQPDQKIITDAKLSAEELRIVLPQLEAVTDDELVEIVGGVPVSWGLTIPESVTLVAYLQERRDQLCQQLRL